MSTVITKEYYSPSVDMREISRYLGCRDMRDDVEALILRALDVCNDKLSYRLCYTEYDLKIDGHNCDLGFTKVESRDLARCLSGCSRILLFAATVGVGIDRLILRYGKSEPSLSVALQAVGSERVESLADEFCREMKEKYALTSLSLRPRFSPGYGDLPLELQRDIFAALGCERRIGVTLNDSLIMSPSKSITAIIGIY